jgi:hypothetical protein
MYQFDILRCRTNAHSNIFLFEQIKFELVTVEILAFGNLEFELQT